jgi:SAM-dependent methyltransferase
MPKFSSTILVLIVLIVLIVLVAVVRGATSVVDRFDSSQDVFNGVYQNQRWGAQGDGSGSGSEPQFAAATVDAIEQLLIQYDAHVIVDAACGACKWTPMLIERVRGQRHLQYIGIDVSDIALERCKINLQQQFPDIVTLYHGDMTNYPFPRADMLICRDVLQHMSYQAIKAAITNFAQSDIRIFALGAYLPSDNQNRDIETGDYFTIDLKQAPFFMHAPIQVVPEANDGQLKYLFIYTKEQLLEYVGTVPFFL